MNDTMNMLFYTPKEIVQKIVDIYNYMAENNNEMMGMRFEDGIRIEITIDASEYKAKSERINEIDN